MPSTFKNRTTPGVYVTEFDAFPPSVVGVQTAVPAFIGYTEKALINGKPVFFKPIPINSLAGYEQIFGKGFKAIYDILPTSPASGGSNWDFEVDGVDYLLKQTEDTKYNLYYSMRLFFDNGGGTCFIVSVGTYSDNGVKEKPLLDGLAAIHEQVGPTMLVIPDAVLLKTNGEFKNVVSKKQGGMLAQCAELQDRVAILDVYGTQELTQQGLTDPANLTKLTDQFYGDVDNPGLNYGMAYFPFLNASVVGPGDINFTNFNPDDFASDGSSSSSQQTILQELLTEVANDLYKDQPAKLSIVEGYIAEISKLNAAYAYDATSVVVQEQITILNQNLSNALPPYQQWQNLIAAKQNLLPPSGAMAGIFAWNDQTRGVWNAPANTTLSSVLSPSVALNDDQQGNLNVPLNGKAIDVIRFFVGRGTVVWGARTLDGNSNDWRYIQVRRTIVYIEQSIKNALNPFVFAANNGQTWATVTSMISNFLEGLWSQGGLMGDKASDAFNVQCGLGSTMTNLDILQGYMVVQVVLQLIRPAEFIELTFKQKMGQ